jgi:cytochrome c oxidase subunit 2
MIPYFNSLLAAVDDEAESFWLPPQASTTAGDYDQLFYFILYLCLAFFLVIVALTVVFAIRYRKRSEEQKTSPIHGNNRLELAWSVIPLILLAVLFFWGFRTWMDTNVPPADAITIRVRAAQWSWAFDYPEHGRTNATELVVPLGKPVKLLMSSSDVLHSFFIPVFRVKRDVLPARYTVVWFEATKKGTFDIFCTEYCGKDHSTMHSTVRVVDPMEFENWAKEGDDKLPPIELGKKLFGPRCGICHGIGKDRESKAGPPLGGVFGKMEEMAAGPAVKVDDAYLRESIEEPNKKVVKNYAPAMPPFKGQFSEKQLNGIIDYIKSLK